MAKRLKKIVHYAYYQVDTKELICLTTEKHPNFKDWIELDEYTYGRLVSGKEKFRDYLIGHVKVGKKTVIKLQSKMTQAYVFRNTGFEVVTTAAVENPELVVEWNYPKKEWNFFLSAVAKKRLRPKLENQLLPFFIILENDYDFLIRTIFVSSEVLFSDECVGVAFEANLETELDKISMLTKLFFESSLLRVVNE